MKTIINKYITGLFICLCLGFTLSSCSEDTMDDINKNNNNPLNVDSRFIMTDLMVSSAFNVVGGDFSLYSSIYMEHHVGIHNQMYNAEIRQGEPTSATTYNNTWLSGYEAIKMAKHVIKKTSDETSRDYGNNLTKGIAYIYLAYNAAILTDLFGDIPYYQAGELDERLLPVYYYPEIDKQETIYEEIFANLDEAEKLIPLGDKGLTPGVATQDVIYKGNAELWMKVVHGLRARYKMRLLAKSENKTTVLNEILSDISKSFTSSGEEFKLNYNGDDQLNPLGAFSYSRDALASSQSFLNKLADRKDPRFNKMSVSYDTENVVSISDDELYFPAPNGTPTQTQFVYNIWTTDYTIAGATQMLSYHELLFLKAEAYARLHDSNAEGALKEAVKAGLANYDSSAKDCLLGNFNFDLAATSDEYFDTEVKPLFGANPIKEIMIQKYLAFNGASGESVEAYNDYRRMQALDEDFITLENPKNAEGKFPYRFVYGADEASYNPNFNGLIGDGSYVYKEKVWWAGGTK